MKRSVYSAPESYYTTAASYYSGPPTTASYYPVSPAQKLIKIFDLNNCFGFTGRLWLSCPEEKAGSSGSSLLCYDSLLLSSSNYTGAVLPGKKTNGVIQFIMVANSLLFLGVIHNCCPVHHYCCLLH